MVAARAGVSTATVSRALSNPDIVVPETRAKVQAAIEELGYAPNFAAKSLRMLRTSKIVMMVPDVSNPFFSEVLRRAEDMAEQAGYSVLLGDTRDDANREAQFADMLQRKEVDGVIFLGHRMPVTLVNAVKDKGPRRRSSIAATSHRPLAFPACISIMSARRRRRWRCSSRWAIGG
ncbi:LacI family DNA-binding transcriptional regulator [Rhizorhabdus histidinilytica]